MPKTLVLALLSILVLAVAALYFDLVPRFPDQPQQRPIVEPANSDDTSDVPLARTLDTVESTSPKQNSSTINLDQPAPAEIFEQMLEARSRADAKHALDRIEKDWHLGSAIMLIEILQFCRDPQSEQRISDIVAKNTGYGKPLEGKTCYSFLRWLWAQPYEPHPEYAKFKTDLFSKLDLRFAPYFKEIDTAKIRLDEVLWGGVRQDGIPALKNPKMVSVKEATYLEDSNVVFGISINGDHRCYPKRILAWHEMFKDTIGGESVCGVY